MAGTEKGPPAELSAVTLIYLDAAGNAHGQPLADITGSGTLIDPDTGDDLDLVSARVSSPSKDAQPEPSDQE